MKNFFLLILTLTACCSIRAQHPMRIGRIQNVSDYSQTTRNGQMLKMANDITNSAPLPTTGSPKIPVILVQFPNLKFSVADTEEGVVANYKDFFNAGEGVMPGQSGHQSACSVKEYFRQESGGKFTPEFSIIGPVTLSEGYEYYGDNGSRGDGGDIHIGTLYSEACKLAVKNYSVDWTEFDNKHNGKVGFVFFIYAGYGENAVDDTYTIWPKESTTSLTVRYDDKTVVFGSYGCTCELLFNGQDGIGPVIHEMGHGLGFPDFYDTTYRSFGMDMWSFMDSGCYIMFDTWIACMNGHERDYIGWSDLIELDPDESYTLTLDPMSEGGKAYKLPNKANTNEYLVLENRQNRGQDKYLPNLSYDNYVTYGNSHGLLVTHIDYLRSSWANNAVNTNPSHQRCTIIPADDELISNYPGYSDAWARSIHKDLYPGPDNVTELTSYKAFTGGTFNFTVDNIRETSDGKIILDINGGAPSFIDAPQEEPTTYEEIYSADGRRRAGLQPGLNIVKTSAGKVLKVMK